MPAIFMEPVGARDRGGGLRDRSREGRSAFGVDESAADGLSAREFEVLRQLVQGKSVREIAQAMRLNPKTISNHQSAIKQKLGADTAIQLFKKAAQMGLELPG